MLLGFISLLLTIGTYSIPAICIPEKIGYTMLPCKRKPGSAGDSVKDSNKAGGGGGGGDKGHRRKLLSYAEDMVWRRVLAESKGKDSCPEVCRRPFF